MPAKNRIKDYVEDSYYHLYNRGVEKRPIFMDEQDYGVFLSYLKTYLLPKETVKLQKVITDQTSSVREKTEAIKFLRLNNFSDDLQLVAFCLMPNHFHFLFHQKEADAIDRFMNSFCTRYSMYFNKRYKRVGPLFQGIYKAVKVTTDEQLLHLSRYIHRNPATKGLAFGGYRYSSYSSYLGLQGLPWVRPEIVLSYFGKSKQTSYKSFVEDGAYDEQSALLVNPMVIDEEWG